MDEDDVRYQGWRVAAASGLGVCLASVIVYSFGVLLRPLTGEFSWSRQEVATAYGVMAVTAALAAPLVGVLLDRAPARRILVPGFVLAGGGMASLALLTSRLAHLYAVFALLGAAASATSSVAYSRAVTSWFERRRGTALALVMCGSSLGGMLLPPLAQALIRAAGWRGACVALGALVAALGVPIAALLVRANPSAPGSAGSRAAGASVPEALRTRAFWILAAVVFGATLASNGAIVHLAALLTDQGIPAGRAALAVSAQGGASFAGRLLTGWMLDRLPPVRVAFGLLVVAALGAFLLAGARTLPMGIAAAVLLGFGTGGELDVIPYLLARYFGLRSLSTLYGFTWTALGAAGATGPILLGRAHDATGSYAGVLTVLSAAMLGVAGLLLALPRRGPAAAAGAPA